jgi:DNA primase
MPGFIDFKELAERIDVEQVAHHLGLQLKRSGNDVRSSCPACQSDNPRALQLFPETNSFRCYSASKSGDCIALYGHIRGLGMYKAAKELQELFGIATASRNNSATAPQKPEGRTAQSQPAPLKKETTFDPEAFAGKLVYSDEVKALNISEEDATRLLIGWHPQRKAIYFPVRNPDGSLSGFVGYRNGELVWPPKWIASGTNVVRIPRRA